jgi:hypothetical protein
MDEHLMDRKFSRHDEKMPVVLENVELGFCRHATMINFSGNGLCCKTDMPYNPGTKIFIKIEKWPNEKSSRVYCGEVTWCREIKTNQSLGYQIGVKIESIKSQ